MSRLTMDMSTVHLNRLIRHRTSIAVFPLFNHGIVCRLNLPQKLLTSIPYAAHTWQPPESPVVSGKLEGTFFSPQQVPASVNTHENHFSYDIWYPHGIEINISGAPICESQSPEGMAQPKQKHIAESDERDLQPMYGNSSGGHLEVPPRREKSSSSGSETSNRSVCSSSNKSPKPIHRPGMPQPKSNRIPYTWVSPLVIFTEVRHHTFSLAFQDLNQDPSKTLVCEDCPVRFARRHDLIRRRCSSINFKNADSNTLRTQTYSYSGNTICLLRLQERLPTIRR